MDSFAYLTFLSDNLYIYYVLALYDSWQKTKSKYPFYCVVTKDVSLKTIDILKQAKISYLELDTSDINEVLEIAPNITRNAAYKKSTQKFKLWTLTQFKKCVYLDSDMVLKTNIDELFNHEGFGAVKDTFVVPYEQNFKYKNGMTIMNGGFFVFEPSEKFYNKLIIDLQNLPQIDPSLKHYGICNGWNDQSLLAYYYPNWLQQPDLQLDEFYNVVINSDPINVKKIPKAKIVHFINNKTDILNGKSITKSLEIFDIWFSYYEQINKIILDLNLNLTLVDLNLIKSENPTNKVKLTDIKKTQNKTNYLYF